MPEQSLLIDVPAHNGNDDENQRYTSPEAIAWVKTMAKVDVFDLDVAACPESHHADQWYGPQVDGSFLDGLSKPWRGDVFCNPPWDDIGPWVDRAWGQYVGDHLDEPVLLHSIAMLLPGNRTHRPWWHQWVEPLRDGRWGGLPAGFSVHFAPKRFAYGGPGNPRAFGVGEPNFTSVLLVWRR